jgi:Protein of unknown function (DUF3040)
MSLPACQERILTGIETALRTGEPRLASRFAIFTRLTSDEALPRREQIEQQPWLKRVGRLRGVLLVPVVLIMVASAVLAASIATASTCVAARQPVTWAAARLHTCVASGAPAHGTRTAAASTQGTPR